MGLMYSSTVSGQPFTLESLFSCNVAALVLDLLATEACLPTKPPQDREVNKQPGAAGGGGSK